MAKPTQRLFDVLVCATANGVKPVIILEELGLPYTCRAVDLRAGEHRTPDLLAINPVGKVPMLIDPDGPGGEPLHLGESGAMASYLARKTGRMGGKTDLEKAHVDYWCQVANATVAMATARLFWITHLAPERSTANEDAARAEVVRFFQVVDDHLTKAGTDFLVGDTVTIADALLWPHTHYSTAMLESGLDQFPALKAYRQRMLQRPTVQRAVAAIG